VNTTTNRLPSSITRGLGMGALALAASLTLAACGSTSAAGGTPAQASPSAAPSQGTGVTIKTAVVAGLGTVLVNAQGRTLYLLTSESGGTLTCTVANGCTQSWPELDLPTGVTAAHAGSGAQSSMLGTETGATGTAVTYDGWPLYTFSGDSSAGQAKGEGLKNFGGTWYVLQASGTPVKSARATSSSSPSSGANGY